jgi:hypothetical protein
VTRLDDMLVRARSLEVRDEAADRYVAELSRWSRAAASPRRSRVPWFAAGFGLAAAAAVIVLLVLRPAPEAGGNAALRFGERVAIIAEPNTQYRVLAADHDRTEVLVERGTVTARLWPGVQPHRLALRGDGVEAVATGTVYALHVGDGGASVHVHEGTVAVTRGSEHAQVEAGSAWSAGATTGGTLRGRRGAERLLAMAAPPPVDAHDRAPHAEPIEPAAEPGSAASDASIGASGDPTKPRAAPVDAGVADATAASLTDRYRQARLLRGQGKFDAAIAECLAIADAKEATWSPIALLEAARIELGPRASPERALVLTDRFEAEWPSHQLAPEARELRCRALRQLGRADECKPQR